MTQTFILKKNHVYASGWSLVLMIHGNNLAYTILSDG